MNYLFCAKTLLKNNLTKNKIKKFYYLDKDIDFMELLSR